MKKLYVGNLDLNVTDQELAKFFAKAGKVVSAVVILNKDTGRSRGFGFVEMSSDEEVKKAIKMFHYIAFNKKNIIVNEAKSERNNSASKEVVQKNEETTAFLERFIEEARVEEKVGFSIGKKPKQKDRKQGRKWPTSKRQTQLRSRNKPPFRCVYSNEWDKYASQIYKKHYGEIDTRDIRTVKSDEIPDHDLLCAGFPCQAFSIAGKRKGFEDTRGTLFFEIARIARDKRPRYILLENVKGLLSHDKGKTFATILGVLSDLGYRVEWQVLNSKHFGVPQNRERVFIIGHLGGFGGRKVFPIGESNQENNKSTQKLRVQYSNTLRTGYGTKWSNETYVEWFDGRKGRKTLKSGRTPEIGNNNMSIRRLTPTECERLQGFPDGWTEGLSDTQRYKCLGNAVTTNVITAIGKKLTYLNR